MKTLRSNWHWLGALALMQLLTLQGGEKLLPGVSIEKIPPDAKGRFILMYSRDTTVVYSENPPPAISNALSAAIYEFDLEKKSLRKITDSPAGFLHSSGDGSAFCVCYGFERSRINGAAFFYTPHDQKSWRVEVKDEPRGIVIIGDRCYFCCDPPWRYPWGNERGGIFEYHIGSRQIRHISMPGESPGINNFTFMHAAPDSTNALHFQFSYPTDFEGNRTNRYGYYSLEASSGKISWLREQDYRDDPWFNGFKTPDGRYIFFKGEGSPNQTFTLVSSNRDSHDTEAGDPKGKDVRVLKRFGAIPRLSSTCFFLQGLSPDRRYAFVAESGEARRPTIMEGGADFWNYYAVDVRSGKTWLMIKDRSQPEVHGCIWNVSWVRWQTRSE